MVMTKKISHTKNVIDLIASGSTKEKLVDKMLKSTIVQVLCVAAALVSSTQASAATYFFHNDHLGTPQVVTDENQQVVWKGEYDPFGKATEVVSDIEQNLRFPGQYFDQETGLHYNYFRTYDPSTGRYVESDPIGLAGGMSTFAYVLNNPAVASDPYGLFEVISGFDTSGLSFSEAIIAKQNYNKTEAGRREQLLIQYGASLGDLIREHCSNSSEAYKRFENWVVYVDPNISDPTKRARVTEGLTDYHNTSTQFNYWFFYGKGNNQISTFYHEFRHTMSSNHALLTSDYASRFLAGGVGNLAIERDADLWANNLISGQCGCE
jgi:RHS repeat-associated protein